MRLIITLLLWTVATASAQDTLVVTNTNDAGPGSLREAITLSNDDDRPTTIIFAAGLQGDTISLISELPEIRDDSTVINGDVDSDGVFDLMLDGVDRSFDGLIMRSSKHNQIRWLGLVRFSTAIWVRVSNDDLILGNRIVDNETAIYVQASPSHRPVISRNSITANDRGIIGSSANWQASFFIDAGTLYGTTEPGAVVEAFADPEFQGDLFLGSAAADNEGVFSLDVSGFDLEGMNVTLTITLDSLESGTTGFLGFIHLKEVDSNNWVLKLANNGNWGYDVLAGNNGGEFPNGSGHTVPFAGGLYVGSLKDPASSNPFVRYAVSQAEFSSDFVPGIIDNESVPFDQLIPGTPTGNPVFVIDPSRSGLDYDHWPFHLGAPLDESGQPLLISSQDSWTVCNDADTTFHSPPHSGFNNPGLGIEVRRSTYQFDEIALPGAENAVFLHWRVTNKTNTDYDSTLFGVWCDTDLGFASDDMMGTDTTRNLVYWFNSDEDATPTGKQYSVGIRLLHNSVSGGSEVPMYSSSFYYNSINPRDPPNDATRYFMLNGLDQDGTIRLNSEGFVDVDGSKFVFPGDPVTNTGILFSSVSPVGGNIRIILTTGPFVLEAGETVDIIAALIGGEANTRLEAITDLRNEADLIESLFETEIFPLLNTDAVSPVLNLGVIQNPESSLRDRVSIYLNADEPLSFAGLDVSQAGGVQEKNLAHLENSDNVWFTDLILDQTGLLSLTLEARDLAGNLATIDRTYTVFHTGGFGKGRTGESPTRPHTGSGTVPPHGDDDKGLSGGVAGKGGSEIRPSLASGAVRATVVSPDGKLTLSLGPDEGPAIFGLLGAEDIPVSADSPVRPRALGATYRVGPDGVATNAILTFRYDPDDRVTDPARLGIYRYANGNWQHVGGELKDGAVSTEITEFGKYGLFYNDGDLVPTKFALDQNYPNPFNPVTAIRYQLPEDSKVTLTVYNVLGQKVRTLVDTKQNAGIYSARWDGKNDFGVNVASGVYMYRIVAGDFVKVRKMLMVR